MGGEYVTGKLKNYPPKPENIPAMPYITYNNYGNFWVDWNDWLGNNGNTKSKVKNALPFEEARKFVRNLGLNNTYEWEDYKKGKLEYLESLPDNIPKSPSSYYKNDGWIGMHDWLGINKNNLTKEIK